jgi:FMN phosphatase YigB (HAD superfamily)
VRGTRPEIRAVTFDFWNTLFVPASSTLLARTRRVASVLQAEEDAVAAEMTSAFEHHSREWRAGRHWGVPHLVQRLAATFDVGPSPNRHAELQAAIEAPDHQAGSFPADGARLVVDRLREAGIRLGIVSDTGFSPGWVLRTMLDAHGLLEQFEPRALAFSDEVGVPKPDPRSFRHALDGLGVDPGHAAHVGDLCFTDVAGARQAGMLAVRYRQYNDDGGGPEAHVVIDRLDQLPAAVGLDDPTVH